MRQKAKATVYQNVLALKVHEEDKEGFYAKSSILTGTYDESANDDTVYENTAYLKNKMSWNVHSNAQSVVCCVATCDKTTKLSR